MTRKAKLEKALAGPKNPLRGEGYSSTTRNWMAGESDTYAVLAPLHAALIEAIEKLEDIRAWCRDRNASSETINLKCLSLSAEALLRIDEAIDSLQLGPDCKPTRDESGT